MFKEEWAGHTVVANASGGRDKQISEFEASLVYRANLRTGRISQKKENKRLRLRQPEPWAVLCWGIIKVSRSYTLSTEHHVTFSPCWLGGEC